MMNKKAIYLAVAATLSVGASVANAAATTYGSELPTTNVLPGGTFLTGVTSFAPTTANPLYLTFTLSAGASFTSIPSLGCTAVSGASNATGVSAAYISLAAGGQGTAVATFVVTGVTGFSMITGCTITNNTATVSAWPTSVSESVSAVYGNALATPTTNSTALLTAASIFTNAVTALTNTALVATGFITFGVADNLLTIASTANVGQVVIALNTTNNDAGAAANASNLTTYITALNISLAGTPLVAGGTTGRVFVTYNNAATATCGGTKLVSAAGGDSAITFSAVAPPAGVASTHLGFCLGVTGQAIPAGTITVSITGTPNTDALSTPAAAAYQISSLVASGTTLGTITRNGSSTEVVNLPPSTNADAGYLRVYNNSVAAGAVTANVYNESGTALATNCTLSSSLAANATLVLAASAVETACFITPPASGRYRVVVNGAFSTMRAQGLARTGGVLVNLSADSSSSGN